MGNEKIDKVFPAAAFPPISAEGGDLARKINADGDKIESTDDVTYIPHHSTYRVTANETNWIHADERPELGDKICWIIDSDAAARRFDDSDDDDGW